MASTNVIPFTNPTRGASSDSLLCGPAPRLQPLSNVSPRANRPARPRNRARRISPQAGKAIEMLGHAIEYLADEHALECLTKPHPAIAGSGVRMHPRIAAIELLKARNREIYLSCPEVETLGERLRAWLHAQRA